MKKILIPIDFSGHTGITCSYALEFARHEGAEIRLFHSFFEQLIIADSSFPESIDMNTMYNEELLKGIFRQAERKMIEFREMIEQEIALKKITGISISVCVTGGEIEQELKDVYTEFRPDIIIVGTKGTGNNLNLWGRVSTMIINHSGIPVMTVPDIQRFQGFGRIMIAADLKEEIAGSIKKLAEMFSPFPIKLFCVHFLSKTKQKNELEKMEILKDQFAVEVKSGLISFEIREVEKDNQETIDSFVKDFGITLIAFQPHKHSVLFTLFSKNITKKNLFATNVPLLALPVANPS